MAKIALLIGISEYEPGLNPLPSAIKDVEAMRRVLVHPDMGGFADADVNVLKNAQRQDIEEAIFHLFNNRKKDDLLLFYFSGHGITDESGKLYLSTNKTRKLSNNSLLTPSSVAASFLHENINKSKSERQVLILDCCFSGAMAKGMTVKDDGSVNVQECLGGRGRAILTSSTSTQYSIVSEDSELSIYTRYIVEGIETGAADSDEDGWISVDGLHEYASAKVKEAAPAMTPKFYPVETGYKINLAKAPIGDPKLVYRRTVEEIAREDNGEISEFNYICLDELCANLKLSEEEADEIEAEVLEPYSIRKNKLRRYEQLFSQAIQKQNPISESDHKTLKRLQQLLRLRDEDILQIHERLSKEVNDTNENKIAIPIEKNTEDIKLKAPNSDPKSAPNPNKINILIIISRNFMQVGFAALIGMMLLRACLDTNFPNDTSTSNTVAILKEDSFADIYAPSGTFYYGGSTTWARISDKLNPEITRLKPKFIVSYKKIGKHPDNSSVSSKAGSETGVSMLIRGEIDFAYSSEKLREEEKQEAQKRKLHLEEIPVAIDGIAIAVSENLAISSLTLEQLKKIYTGEFTNWSQIEPTINEPITAYSRDSSSGTVTSFQEKVLGNNSSINFKVVKKAIETKSGQETTDTLGEVRQKKGAIYFTSSSHVFGEKSQCDIKPLSLRLASGEEISPYQLRENPTKRSSDCSTPIKDYLPNEKAFQSDTYPLTRKIYVIINRDGGQKEQAGEAYANLLKAVLKTPKGQELIKEAGFVSLP
jgi:ABC-type phosphate transport system substrate-binding protein/uncharacterized caspase-like protein